MKYILFLLAVILVACSSSKDDVITTPDYVSDTPSTYNSYSSNSYSSPDTLTYHSYSSADSSASTYVPPAGAYTEPSSPYTPSTSTTEKKGFFSTMRSNISNLASEIYSAMLGDEEETDDTRSRDMLDKADAQENIYSRPARNQYERMYQETATKIDELKKEFKANVDAEFAAQDYYRNPYSESHKRAFARRMRRLMRIRERNQSKGFPVGLELDHSGDLQAAIRALKANYDYLSDKLDEMEKEKNKYLELSY
ncbi:MAG TPA: hypothetical protein P5543_07290 [Planctomycetota bacterium]|nr:hypothetical protein [Planctomycetota bacterium]HRU51977.1 hypothetical protein [Planctomycetota bacterium]